jgi:shikimate kinase
LTTHPSKTENKQQSMEQLSFDSLLEEISEPKINTPDKMNAGESNTYQQININSKRFPLNLVIDFDYFINYVGIHPVILTNTQEYISRKHLPAINAQLSMKAGNITDNSRQEYYPYIHFFFHLALRGHLMEKTVISGGKLQLRLTERSKLFHDLSDTEKYFLLLETFWVDLNWTDLQKEHSGSVHYLLPDILTKLIGMKSHSKLYIGKHDLLDRFMFDWHYFLLYFQWFGLWICEKDQKKIEKYGKKNNYFAKTITITSFGRKMFPILMHDRDPQVWNIALRQEQGEVNPIPGSALIGVKEDKQQNLFLKPLQIFFTKKIYTTHFQEWIEKSFLVCIRSQ